MPANAKNVDFFDKIQVITEKFLSYRKMKRRIKREEQKAKNPLIDWVGAFVWAACMVLLANQYLVQAYRIPSGSMIDTLNIGDHIFVNKIKYGPELLPGVLKIPSVFKPKRNDIIIFENPSYLSKGPVFDIVQRILYMVTLTLVDIDKEDNGEPRVHFLIKRAVGAAGDRFVLENGNMRILFSGEKDWVTEHDYIKARGWNHKITRIMKAIDYTAIAASGQASALIDMEMTVPEDLLEAAEQARSLTAPDFIAHEKARLETLRKLTPNEKRYSMLLARHRLGWYIGEGRIFPLGDNRDNSRDGRYFGPVRMTRVLGSGMIVFWPLWRMRNIK
jgi:signal peptidase I